MDATRPTTPGIWRLRGASYFQMLAFGIIFPFEALWMKHHGLGETYIGVYASIATVLGFFAGFFWGKLSDLTQLPHRIIMAGMLVLSANWFFLAYSQTPLQFLLYSIARGLAFGMVMNLMPVLAMSVLGSTGAGRGYGFYRVFGSFGWTTGTLLIPQLTQDLQSIILTAAVGVLIAPLPLIGFPNRPTQAKHFVSVRLVLRNATLRPLYIAVLFMAAGMPAMFQFTPLYAAELGAGTRFVGLFMGVNGVAAIIGLPLMGLLTDRVGPRRLIALGLLATPVRIAGYGLVTGPPVWMLLPQALHIFTWAGFEIAAVLYVSRHAAEGNRATAMAVYFGAHTVGVFLGAFVAGYLAENVGYPPMFFAMGGLTTIGVVVWGVSRWTARRRGDMVAAIE